MTLSVATPTSEPAEAELRTTASAQIGRIIVAWLMIGFEPSAHRTDLRVNRQAAISTLRNQRVSIGQRRGEIKDQPGTNSRSPNTTELAEAFPGDRFLANAALTSTGSDAGASY